MIPKGSVNSNKNAPLTLQELGATLPCALTLNERCLLQTKLSPESFPGKGTLELPPAPALPTLCTAGAVHWQQCLGRSHLTGPFHRELWPHSILQESQSEQDALCLRLGICASQARAS